jgi:5-carboxymethyl-2-hydroxymuconate isomerase
MLNFCGIVVAILKMETGRNFLISGINSGRSNQTMWNLCGIVAAILKMATGRNFSMSGINSGHHNLPTYEMSLKSDNVEFVRYCGGHFENGDR